MSREIKFEGGTRLTTFRLPIEGYKEVREAMNKVLDSFRKRKVNDVSNTEWKDALLNKNMLGSLEFVAQVPTVKKPDPYVLPNKPKITISKELKEKLKELDPNIVVPQDKKEAAAYEKDGSIYYPCGCRLGLDKFYRNVPHCTLGYTKEHKEKYGM